MRFIGEKDIPPVDMPWRNTLIFKSICVLLSGDKMDKGGRLTVDEFLQVKGVPDVYAVGDCNDLPEIKLAYGAEVQGKYVADFLKNKHEGQTAKPYNVNSKLLCAIHFSGYLSEND